MSPTKRRVPLEAKGVALLLVLALLVWLSVAVYQKRFVRSVDVTLRVERAGLMLPVGGDVRMRGSLIGRIASVELGRDGVDITLALDPDDAAQVPADAVGRILPTTLFGVKYVELVDPHPAAAGPAVSPDDVLAEDDSRSAVEITRVLDRLEPVLAAVDPAQLSVTLQAVATGLDGRGEQIGRLGERTLDYLAELESSLPSIVRDLDLLSAVAHIYADATPDILRMLDNVTVTGTTVVDNQRELADFLDRATQFAISAREFLDHNGDGIADLNRATRPVLELLGEYAPQLPCVVRGLIMAESEAGKAFRDGVFHAYVRIGKQYPAYDVADLPEFGDLGAGPNCRGLPHPDLPIPESRSRDGGDYPRGSLLPPVGGAR